MKKKLLLPVFLGVSFFSEAQNIGINTTSPQATLDVRGGQRIGGINNYVKYDSATSGAKLQIYKGSSGITPFFEARVVVESNNHTYVNLLAQDPFETGILFGSGTNAVSGAISYNNTTVQKGFIFSNNGNQARMVITNAGNVGIGTMTPASVFDVIGNASGIISSVGNFQNTSTFGGVVGVQGVTINGIGVHGKSEYIGVEGSALGSGAGTRYGLYGGSLTGAGFNIAVYGNAYGGTNAYGIWGSASGGTTSYAGYFSGDVFSTGTYTSSDRKLKSNINSLSDALAIINQLNPSVYTYRTSEYKPMHLADGLHYGLIADEVQQVLPGTVRKAVQPAEYENHDERNGKKLSDAVEFNAINYTEMIPILIGGMKEQQQVIQEQNKKIEMLNARLDKLEKIVAGKN
jgi:hypothetical protein